MKILLSAMIMMVSMTAFAKPMSEYNEEKTIVIKPSETGYVKGVITSQSSKKIIRYLNERRDAKKNAFLVIDSNGGSVVAGLRILRAMDEVKSETTRVHCAVKGHAISMAFAILSNCDVKVADPHSVLMFHNVRLFLQFYVLRAVDAKRLFENLERFDTHLAALIAPVLGIDLKKYKKLADDEILYSTTAFNKEFPKFNLRIYNIKDKK